MAKCNKLTPLPFKGLTDGDDSKAVKGTSLSKQTKKPYDKGLIVKSECAYVVKH